LKSNIEKLQKEIAKLKSSIKKKKFGLVWMAYRTPLIPLTTVANPCVLW